MRSTVAPSHLIGILLATVTTLVAGCQTLQVERKTVAMASRLSDLQYGQVLNNLALIADNPSALPHFVLTDTGKTLIQATKQASVGLTWNLFTAGRLFDTTLLGNVNPALQYLQQDQDEWDGTPALDPIQELVMRGVYLRALGVQPSPAELAATQSFFTQVSMPFDDTKVNSAMIDVQNYLLGIKPDPLPSELAWSLANYKPAYYCALRETYERIVPGHVHVGQCKDVPRDACYVGKHQRTYVWVMKEDMEVLTNITIAILDVASTDTTAQAGKASKQPSPKLYTSPAGIATH